MNAIAISPRLDLDAIASRALSAAARFWFVVTLLGQWMFAFAVASFYGLTAWRGDYHRWGKFISHGLIRGDTVVNLAIVVHLIAAVAIKSAGALRTTPTRSRCSAGCRRSARPACNETVKWGIVGPRWTRLGRSRSFRCRGWRTKKPGFLEKSHGS